MASRRVKRKLRKKETKIKVKRRKPSNKIEVVDAKGNTVKGEIDLDYNRDGKPDIRIQYYRRTGRGKNSKKHVRGRGFIANVYIYPAKPKKKKKK